MVTIPEAFRSFWLLTSLPCPALSAVNSHRCGTHKAKFYNEAPCSHWICKWSECWWHGLAQNFMQITMAVIVLYDWSRMNVLARNFFVFAPFRLVLKCRHRPLRVGIFSIEEQCLLFIVSPPDNYYELPVLTYWNVILPIFNSFYTAGTTLHALTPTEIGNILKNMETKTAYWNRINWTLTILAGASHISGLDSGI